MSKELISVRLEGDTLERAERYAEKHDVSRSTAIRRLLEKGADLEETGITVAASQTNTESDSEGEPIADGGTIVRDILNLMSALYATLTLSIFAGIGVSAVMNIPLPFANTIISWIFTLSLLTAVVTIPLYTDLPEKADRLLYSGISHVPVIGKVVA